MYLLPLCLPALGVTLGTNMTWNPTELNNFIGFPYDTIRLFKIHLKCLNVQFPCFSLTAVEKYRKTFDKRNFNVLKGKLSSL
jgi:hypothetical protein